MYWHDCLTDSISCSQSTLLFLRYYSIIVIIIHVPVYITCWNRVFGRTIPRGAHAFSGGISVTITKGSAASLLLFRISRIFIFIFIITTGEQWAPQKALSSESALMVQINNSGHWIFYKSRARHCKRHSSAETNPNRSHLPPRVLIRIITHSGFDDSSNGWFE